MNIRFVNCAMTIAFFIGSAAAAALPQVIAPQSPTVGWTGNNGSSAKNFGIVADGIPISRLNINAALVDRVGKGGALLFSAALLNLYNF